MEINRNLFNLEEIYVNVNQAVALSLYDGLLKAKTIFTDCKKQLIEEDEILNQDEISDINEQLEIVNTNIATLIDVLKIYESKQCEKYAVFEDLKVFWLN